MTRKRKLIIAAVAVVALAVPVVADRVTDAVIERRVADRLQCAAGLPDRPEVSLGGFPALTQLGAGRLDEVRVSADQVTVAKATLSRVTATARNVRLPGAGGVDVGSVAVEATVSYASLADRFAGGFPITQIGADDAGRLVLDTEVTVRGLTLPATLYADLSIAGGQLTFTPAEVELSALGLRLPAGRLPAEAARARTVDLPALPAGLTYASVGAAPDGLTVVVGGTGLHAGPGITTKTNSCGGTAK